LRIKKGMIQDATFTHSDHGHIKADTSRENEAKAGKSRNRTSKRGYSHTLDINFIA
jgi:IS5 family transposase